MEDPAQLKEQIESEITNTRLEPGKLTFKRPSNIHVVRVIFKLLPVVINFRRDRRKWVKHEGKNIDEWKFRKHAKKALKIFIELGPSYIKLGQWLSSRADLLPLPYLEELSKLQDEVPPAEFSKVEPIIESEIGKIKETFESFDTSALSGASLGQVYLAKYNKRDVIIKVSRPAIEEVIENDIYILKKILPLATRFIDPNLAFSAEGMLSQFIETIYEEMDYRIEADNLITIKRNLAGDNTVIIPSVFPERTSKHVLTMEYIPGVKITDIAALDAMNIDRPMLVTRVHRLFFKMLLRHNIFHADPHPGNISVADDGSIILYDFGMVGRLDNKTRLRLIRLYLGMIDKDPTRTVNVLMELGTLEPTVNRHIVEKAIEFSIQSLYGKEVDKMEVKALTDLANKTMSRFPFRLPKNLALYMRMASILEGVYQHHKVKFQFVKVLAKILEGEGLLKDAYIEEARTSVYRLGKNIESALNVAPMIQSYLETQLYNNPSNKIQKDRNNTLIAGAILATGLFIGSSIVLPHDINIAYAGFIGSVVTITVATIRKKFW
ncbi:MAG TPA: AarF/ABC1/UbiB kinase family protein [Nitrososphaeraceae archaeon]|nr:AarF/ABC1/UbiB kinase family protein [Nitrososphaeraceae archaeon]